MNRIAPFSTHESTSVRTYGSVDWTKEVEVSAFATERWESRQRRLGHLEKQWYINTSFFLGQQWITWDSTTRAIRSTDAPPWRVRLTINLVQGVARKIVAKILAAKPTWAVSPATGDSVDIERSRIGEKVARGYWNGKLRMGQNLWHSLNWMSVCGTGGLRLYWDQTAGDTFEASIDDIDDKKTRDKVKKRSKRKDNKVDLNTGDAAVEPVPPFALDPDPAATGPEDLTHLIHSRLRSRAWVKERYPEKADRVQYGSSENKDHYERRLSDMAGPQAFETLVGGSSDNSVTEDGVVVHDIWGLPVPGHPGGVHAVVAGDVVLALEENPYRYDGQVALPFAIFREIVVPGRFWGTCALEQALGLQSNLNASRSQLVENRNMMSRPKWAVPRGANIGDHALTSEPGEVFEHTPGLEPKPVTPPPLPPYVIRELEQTRQDFQDVTHLHEVSNAQAPANVRSGVAIAQLQEQDTTVLIPTIHNIEFELAKLGSMLLHLLSLNVDEERLIKIVGEETSTDFQSFTGSQLKGDRDGVNYFDVNVSMASQLGLSKEAQRNTVIQLAQLFPQLFATETAQKKLLEMVDVGSTEPLYDESRLDLANASMENREMFSSGALPIAHASDNDEIHLAEHNRFQKTPEYRRKVEEDPEIEARFETHKRMHAEALEPPPPPAPEVPGVPMPQDAMAGAMPVDVGQIPPEALQPPPVDINEALMRDLMGGSV